MNRIQQAILLFLSLLLFLTKNIFSYAAKTEENKKKSFFIGYADSGLYIQSENENLKIPMGDSVKLITALLILEKCAPTQMVTVLKEDVEKLQKIGKKNMLVEGETVNVNQALHLYLLGYADELGFALMRLCASSVEEFIGWMNEKAVECNAHHTKIVSINGTDDPQSTSTVQDLFFIAQHAIKNKDLLDILGKESFMLQPTNSNPNERILKNENKLLSSRKKLQLDTESVPIQYEGAKGLFITRGVQGMHILMAYVERNNTSLILIETNPDMSFLYQDAHLLLNDALTHYKIVPAGFSGKYIESFKVQNAQPETVVGILANDIFYTSDSRISDPVEMHIEKNEKDLLAPIKKGQILGTVKYLLADGTVLVQGDIIAAHDVSVSARDRFSLFLKLIFILSILSSFALLLKLRKCQRKILFYKRRLKNIQNRQHSERW